MLTHTGMHNLGFTISYPYRGDGRSKKVGGSAIMYWTKSVPP